MSPQGPPSEEVRRLLTAVEDPLVGEALKPFEQMGMQEIAAIKGTRNRLRAAAKLLHSAGYTLRDGQLFFEDRRVVLKLVQVFGGSSNTRLSFLRDSLAKLGIELEVREVSDVTTYMVETRKKNDYDLMTTNLIVIAPRFEVLNMNYLSQIFGSAGAKGDSANGARLNSPMLDHVMAVLSKASPGTPEYAQGADAFLRALSANLPFFMTGDRVTSPLYAAEDMCVFPIGDNEQTIYFGCKN